MNIQKGHQVQDHLIRQKIHPGTEPAVSLIQYKYPPEEVEDAMNVVLKQWAENEVEMASRAPVIKYEFSYEPKLVMVTDDSQI